MKRRLLMPIFILLTAMAWSCDTQTIGATENQGDHYRNSAQPESGGSAMTSVISFLAVLAAAGCAIILFGKKGSPSRRRSQHNGTEESSRPEADHSELDKRIQEQMDRVHEKFWPQFVSYEVTKKAITLEPGAKKDLAREYGQTFSMPVIAWPEEFDFVPTKYYSRVGEGIFSYMHDAKMTCSKDGSPSYMFEETLLGQARERANEIVAEKLGSESEAE